MGAARNEDNLLRAFRAFDRDDDGVITLNEIEETMRMLEGSLVSAKQVEELNAALYVELQKAKVERTNEYFQKFPRKVDFGEFMYLCNISQDNCRTPHTVKKEIFRLVRRVPPFHLDCYRVYPLKGKTLPELQWPPTGEDS